MVTHEPNAQDIRIYRSGDAFVGVGEIDRTACISAVSAQVAIQAAIDLVGGGPGGRVCLGPGRYPVDRTLRLAPGVTLCGSGRGTVIDVEGSAETGVLIERVKGAAVCDLAIHGGGPGRSGRAAIGLDVADSADCRVHGVLAQGFAQHGIRLRDSAILCRVHDCTIADNAAANLKLQHLDKGQFGNWIPNQVSNCTILGGGKGVEIERCIVLTLNGLQVYQTDGPAFHVHSVSNAVSIVGCRTYQITGDAVLWEESHEASIVGNVFSWHTERGIVAKGCTWGVISGNNVIDTGSFNPGGPCMKTRFADLESYPPSFPGIRLEDCRGFTVSGNALFQWPVVPPMTNGIEEDEASADNLIGDNQSNFYRGVSVSSLGTDTSLGNNGGYKPSPLFRRPPVGVPEPLFAGPDHAIQSFEPHLTRQLLDRGYADP